MKLQMKWIALAGAGIGICAPVMAQQASITLLNSDVAYCYKQDNNWKITKTNDKTGVVPAGTPVTWTITATKTTDPKRQFCVLGMVTVSNTGSAPATIGNIVVDIQRGATGQNKWRAIAADMADATNGDNSTSDLVLSAALASQTDYGPVIAPTTTSGATKFIETAPSGALDFMDAASNTVWAISPAQTIPVGGAVTLNFKAAFAADNILPALNPGESLRTEVLVSFGNSGNRGGSGASGSNIDINGNGVNTDGDEKNVRTVPTRLTYPVPALQLCNDSVAVTDSFSYGGSTSVTNLSGDPAPGTMINASTVYTVTGTVNGDGIVTNTATLDGMDIPVYTTLGVNALPCCVAIHTSDSSSVAVGTATLPTTKYCSYSRNEFLHQGDGHPILLANFMTAATANVPFSGKPACSAANASCTVTGVTIGTAAAFHSTWTDEHTFEDAIDKGGSNGTLTANLYNPSSVASGKFPKNVAALVLNVRMAGISPSIGNLVYNNPGDTFHGWTVSQILDAANNTLATGTLPLGYTLNSFDGLVDQLNQAWNRCKPNALVNQGALVEHLPN